MREQSQINDMRAAIRGDLERARASRESDPWREPEGSEPDLRDGIPDPELLEIEPEPAPALVHEPEPVEAEPVPVEPEDVEEPAPATPRRGFFGSLFRRG